jgi:hypothetical protein
MTSKFVIEVPKKGAGSGEMEAAVILNPLSIG